MLPLRRAASGSRSQSEKEHGGYRARPSLRAGGRHIHAYNPCGRFRQGGVAPKASTNPGDSKGQKAVGLVPSRRLCQGGFYLSIGRGALSPHVYILGTRCRAKSARKSPILCQVTMPDRVPERAATSRQDFPRKGEVPCNTNYPRCPPAGVTLSGWLCWWRLTSRSASGRHHPDQRRLPARRRCIWTFL
jgi:hypothetical protein